MGGQRFHLDFERFGIADLDQGLAGQHRAFAFAHQLEHACFDRSAHGEPLGLFVSVSGRVASNV
jgi:hypothetical protein